MGSAEETKARILAAAAAEFARHGIAGARVDRIASGAGVNKERIYAYFHDKARLFATVMDAKLSELLDAVHLEADDVVGYVGRLYDYGEAHPELSRLGTWARLEGAGLELPGSAVRLAATRRKLEALRAAQKQGLVSPDWHPVDLLVLISTLAGAIRGRSAELAQLDRRSEATARAQLRAAVVEATRRIVAPG